MASHTIDGYCDACKQNIPHVRRIHHPTLNLVDRATFRLCRYLRLGSWHCIQCGSSSLHLAKPRRDIPSIQLSDSQVENEEAELVGNFIRGSQSLVLRRSRANRFSEKYRDSVVQRLVDGSTTISQLGRELELSEVDIVDWIADLLARRQSRINELTRLVDSLPQSTERLLGYDPDFVVDEYGGEGEVDAGPEGSPI